MVIKNLNNRVVVFPNKGNLLVCSDLHGNKEDYLQMLNLFESELKNLEETYLLFLGDLIHGPDENSKFNYIDESEFIIDHFMKMQKVYDGKIFSLLGNHEHGHVGGPHTPKFHQDEVLFLENLIGEDKTKKYHELFNNFPLFAITPTGVCFSHGAPSANINELEEIINVEYSGHSKKSMSSMFDIKVLDLLWRRGSSDDNAKRFLNAVKYGEIKNNLLVYGHDVVEEGYYREGPHHMILSTSFRVEKPNKTFLKIDLSKSYLNTEDLRENHELLHLWGMDRKVDYAFFDKFLENDKFVEAESFLDQVDDISYQHSLNLGKLNLAIYENEGRVIHLKKAIINLEKSLNIEYGIAETHFLLGESYEKIADLSETRDEKLVLYNRSMGHYRQVDTYAPINSFDNYGKDFRVKRKMDDLSNLTQLY